MDVGDVHNPHAVLAKQPELTGSAAEQHIGSEDIESLLPGKPLSPAILQLFFRHVLPAKLRTEPGGSSAASSCCVLDPGLYPDLCAAAQLHAECRAAAYQEALDRYPVPLGESADSAAAVSDMPISARLASRSFLLFPIVGGHDPLGASPVSLLLACTSSGLLLHLDSQQGAVVGPRNDAKCLLGHLPAGYGSDAQLVSQPVTEEVPQAVKPNPALAHPVRLFLQFLGHPEAANWPLMSAKVPLQRRLADSALFAATNALYLLPYLPAMLTPTAVNVLDAYRDTELDLLHGTSLFYPGFLTRQWYPPETAEALRRELARAVRIRAQQAASYAGGTLAASDTALLSRLAEVEKRLEEDCRRREFQMPLQRYKRQEYKKRRRVQQLTREKQRTRWDKLAVLLRCDPATEGAAKAALKKLQAQLLGSQPGSGATLNAGSQPDVDIAGGAHPAAATAAGAGAAAGPAQRKRPQRASSRGVSDAVRRAQQQDEVLEELSQSSEFEPGAAGSDSDVSEQIAKVAWPGGVADRWRQAQRAQQAQAHAPVAQQPPQSQLASARGVVAPRPGPRPVLLQQQQGLPAAHASEARDDGSKVLARTGLKERCADLFPMAAAAAAGGAASVSSGSTALLQPQHQHAASQQQQHPEQQRQTRQPPPLSRRALAGAYRQAQADEDMLDGSDDVPYEPELHFSPIGLPYVSPGTQGSAAGPFSPTTSQQQQPVPVAAGWQQQQQQQAPEQQQRQAPGQQQQQQQALDQNPQQQRRQIQAVNQPPGLPGQRAAAAAAPHRMSAKRPAQQQAALDDEAGAAKVPRISDPRCHKCGKSGKECGTALKRCQGCKAVHYCSAHCQHQDWREGHEHVCRGVSSTRAAEAVAGSRPAPAPAPSPPAPPPPPRAGSVAPDSSPAALPVAASGGRREAAGSSNRVYSKWTANGRGGYTKELTLSDLNKLRIKGGALADHIDSSDQNVVLSLVADAAGTSNGALPPHQRIAFVVGLWRPKSGLEVQQQLVSLQAGWPAVVSRLKMLAGDTVELQPDGRERLGNGTTRSRLLLSVRRAAGRSAVAQATAPTFLVKGMGSGGGVGAAQPPVAGTYSAAPVSGQQNVLGKTVSSAAAAAQVPKSEHQYNTLLGLQAALRSPMQKHFPQRQQQQ